MTMTYDEVQPDTRVICHSRGGLKGTVLRKFMGGKDKAEQLVYIAFDEGGPAHNTPEQLSPINEPAPEPKLSRAYKGSSSFWIGGHEYEVFNTTGVGDVRGYWACIRRSHDGTAHTNEAYIVSGADSRKAAFELALEKLKVRKIVKILPRRYMQVTVPKDERDDYAYPSVRVDGWVAAWHTDGYVIVFENGRERGMVWADRPIEAKIIGRDGREHAIDGEFRHLEAGVLAVYVHHMKARVRRAVDVELLPVIVTELPDDEDHAPLLVDPAAARVVRAADVADGDTVLASFPDYGKREGMLRSDYFNDQYEAHPMPYDPTHGCGSCATMADHEGEVVNLGDDNPWEVCDPHAADALLLVVPARRI
ncbi:hypothetical protein AB0N17_20165 [Streptomyces sp. NPDC051133]|uniref:hypothetical protein n=1 Tax=Streptomyces sp. NPDC051133 TaxID=3155521 RepID=UPI00343D0B53